MTKVYLSTPFSKKDEAKKMGAKWDPKVRMWYAPNGEKALVERWPINAIPINELVCEDLHYGGNQLFVDLVPASCWFTNVRKCVAEEDWERLRKFVYARASNKCECCGRHQSKEIHLEAHERWHYDHSTKTQKLMRIIALCHLCHQTTHMGFARTQGKEGQAVAHLCEITGMSEKEAGEHIDEAYAIWLERNKHSWELDLSIIVDSGIQLKKQYEKKQRVVMAKEKALEVGQLNLNDISRLFDEVQINDAKVEEMLNKSKNADSYNSNTIVDDEQLSSFSLSSLQNIRKKLLDLSNRNSLLNYKWSKLKTLEITNHDLNALANTLQEGKPLNFIGIPDPTKAQISQSPYANILKDDDWQRDVLKKINADKWNHYLQGQDDSLNLSNKQTSLQVSIYQSTLSQRLKAIRSSAQMILEETGSNALYLVIGLLQWDDDGSDKSRDAPLYIIPVRLTYSKHGASSILQYAIELDGDCITNTTLYEKLKESFGLSLPNIEDEIEPSAYLQLVEKHILEHKTGWNIVPKVGLALLNFTKQVMYQDLNPDNWANDEILTHPVIKRYLSDEAIEAEDDSYTYSEPYAVDKIANIHQAFPLIYPADSSQHSALVDAVNGENLVIEGPPGTGKSQTITNIIAAAIANGKRVLFVAEKMAALNVVKSRLDKAGLGDFCLELHSHKSNKQKVLHELNDRINKQKSYLIPAQFDEEIARFEELKCMLSQYADQINQPWKNTGLSMHELLSKAVRYRKKFKFNLDDFEITDLNAEQFTMVESKNLFDDIDMFVDIYRQTAEQAINSDIYNHYWCGVNNTTLAGAQFDDLKNKLNFWTLSLERLADFWQQQNIDWQTSPANDVLLNAIIQFVTSVSSLPESKGEALFSHIPKLISKTEELLEFIQGHNTIHKEIDNLKDIFQLETINHPENAINDLSKGIEQIKNFGCSIDCHIQTLAKDYERLDNMRTLLEDVRQCFQSIKRQLPQALFPVFQLSYNGLSSFNEFCSLIKSLPFEYWRHRNALFDNSDLDPLIEQLLDALTDLAPLHKLLCEEFTLDNLPCASELKAYRETLDNKGILRFFSSHWRKTRKTYFLLANKTKPNKTKLITLLPKLITYQQGMENVNRLNKENTSLQTQYQGIGTPIERINTLRKWYKKVRKTYGNQFGEKVAVGDELLELDKDLAIAIYDTAEGGLFQKIENLQKSFLYFQDKFPELKLQQDDVINFEIDSGFERFYVQLQSFLEYITLYCLADVSNSSLKLSELEQKLSNLQHVEDKRLHWINLELTKYLVPEVLPLSTHVGENLQIQIAKAQETLDICNILRDNITLKNALLSQPNFGRYVEIKASLENFNTHLSEVNATQKAFYDLGQINEKQWLYSSTGAIKALIAKNKSAIDNDTWLSTWLAYVLDRNKLANKGLEQLIAQVENQFIQIDDLNNFSKATIYHQLSKELLMQCSWLNEFSGNRQDAIRQKFKEYDLKLLQIQRQKIAHQASQRKIPGGINSGKTANYSELSLIKHEASKKTRHIALRSLMQRAGGAIQSLKPCFMMSPMSVAQYLSANQFHFDIVIMDEASQIRPEDALGAIARGKSIVVVGDPKQLPPTDFFKKATSEENDEEQSALETSKSILDSFIPVFKTRCLSWHYRSQHQSLITFSNQQFYDSNLIIFPSCIKSSSELGIHHHYIGEAEFIKGVNAKEAQMVAQYIANTLCINPQVSIGVVAMNQAQSSEIERYLEELLYKDSVLQQAHLKNRQSAEPLFIKNLENVQGDERDIIVISMTYGCEPDTQKVAQRFGPINYKDGWRRLNVLLTRAKKKMEIFTSMNSGDILCSEGSAQRGKASLKAFLHFCESGHTYMPIKTGNPPQSDFEIAVIEMLQNYGYQCEAHLGVAGYYLDIAVINPNNSEQYLLAIECDGASYHSAKSARDRDHLRQSVLENLGWKVIRIWSSDWFKNPQAQIQPILNALEKASKSCELGGTKVPWH